jgi:hypothetical protein
MIVLAKASSKLLLFPDLLSVVRSQLPTSVEQQSLKTEAEESPFLEAATKQRIMKK